MVIASIGDGTVPYAAVTDVFLVGGVRTPFGRYRGALADARPDDLAALVVREALTRGRVPDDAVDEVILGAANQAGEDNRNVARMAILLAGLPDAVPGYTVNRLCASSLQAVASAAQQIRSGEADVVVAGGVESMTRAPSVLAKPGRAYATPPELADTTLGWRLVNPRMRDVDGGKATISLGDTAEEVAILDGITREDSDAFGLRSQRLAAASAERRRADLVPVPVGRATVETRTRCRGRTRPWRPSRPCGRRSAATASSRRAARRPSPTARPRSSSRARRRSSATVSRRAPGVVAAASAGVPPHVMGLGPVPSTERVLARAGWTTDDLDAIEINEAFAPQVIASVRRLGLDPERVNAEGGAIALGHPLGASGARLVLDLLRRLEHEGGRRGLATLCIGVGQGLALLVERPG